MFFFEVKKSLGKFKFTFVYAATKVVSEGPIINNGTQCPTEKSNVWCLEKAGMNVFAETKLNLEKAIYENIFGKEILSRKRERKGKKRCYGSLLVATIHL